MSKCGKCALEVTAETGSIRCRGCNYRYHYQCSLSSSTWKAKSQDGKDAWRCEACRRQAKQQSQKSDGNDDTDDNSEKSGETRNSGESDIMSHVQATLKPLFEEHTKVASNLISESEKNLKNHVQAVHKNTEKLVTSLCSKIDELCKSLKCVQASQEKLLEDNVLLKNELRSAKEKISSLELKIQPAVPSHTSYANVILDSKRAGSSNPQHSKSHSSVVGDLNAAHVNQQISPRVNGSQPRHQLIAQQSHGSSSTTRTTNTPSRAPDSGPVQRGGGVGGTDGGDWQVQTNRRRGRTNNSVPIKIGTKQQASSVPLVRPKDPTTRTSALFVTRFAPEVKARDIKELVESSLSLSQLNVSKIKTRRQDLYSSFHVEVLESDFEKIDDVSIWPDGCMIKPYQGRLLPRIVLQDDPANIVPDNS